MVLQEEISDSPRRLMSTKIIENSEISFLRYIKMADGMLTLLAYEDKAKKASKQEREIKKTGE